MYEKSNCLHERNVLSVDQGLWFFLCPMLMTCWSHHNFPISSPSLKVTIFLSTTHMTFSTLPILAVRRTHLIHEPCIWPSSPQVLRSSVVGTSNWCTEGHKFNPCWDSDFFFVPCLCHVDHIISHFFTELKIYHLPSFITNRNIFTCHGLLEGL